MDTPLSKSLKPKHLNFDEMWKLYKILKPSLPNKNEKYLIDEVSKIMQNINNATFKDSLLFIYGYGFQTNRVPAEFLVLFIRGLKENDFFTFFDFIQSLFK